MSESKFFKHSDRRDAFVYGKDGTAQLRKRDMG